jgi:hypothetical protein
MRYATTTKDMIVDFLSQFPPGQTLRAETVLGHLRQHYPLLQEKTVKALLEGLSTNNPSHRRYNPQMRPETDWDHLFKLGRNLYRRYEPGRDPQPVYASAPSGEDAPAVPAAASGDLAHQHGGTL